MTPILDSLENVECMDFELFNYILSFTAFPIA